MRLISLTITKLPGISKPLQVTGLNPGINFITGPNASGKSSVIRALGYLVNPPQKDDPIDLILEAQFIIDDQTWEASRIGTEQVWRVDGQPDEMPKLPMGDVLACHLIRIEDLFSLNRGTDEQLAETLRVEMDGGFNLRRLKSQLQHEAKATARNEKRAVREAKDQLNEVKREHRALEHQRRTLPELEKNIAKAKQSAQAIVQLKAALETLEQQVTLNEHKSRLAAFPASINRLTGQELDQINDLQSTVRSLNERLMGLEQTIKQSTQTLKNTGLSDARPSEEDIASIGARAQKLSAIDQEIDALTQRLGIAHAQLAQAQARLNLDSASSDHRPNLSLEAINEATVLARKIDLAHAAQLNAKPPKTMLSLTGFALSGITAALLVVVGALSETIYWVLAGALLSLITSLLLLRPRKDIDPSKHTMRSPITDLESEAKALAKKLGFNPALLSEASAAIFTDAYRQYREAEQEELRLMEKLNHHRQNKQQIADHVREFLNAWSTDASTSSTPLDDTETLHARLNNLTEKHRTASRALETLDKAQQDQALLNIDLDKYQKTMEAIYEKAELAHGAKQDLENLIKRREQWVELKAQTEQLSAIVNDRLDGLRKTPELIEAIETGHRDSLMAMLDQHQADSETLDDLQEKRIRILQAIEQTTEGHDLAGAIAKSHEAMDALEQRRQSVIMAETGLLWLELIEKETRQSQGDQTIDQARHLFSQFTHHQWALEVDESFHAIKQSDQTRANLSELSTATRMQLLLAVRMARALKSEQGHSPFPLIIDEALTTSDAQRASTIIENLNTLCLEQNRQIIYLAASDYELQLWRHIGGVDPTVIWINSTGPEANDKTLLAVDFSSPPAIPRPDGLSTDAYAMKIGVSAFRLWSAFEDLHVFYLLADDLSLLYELMSTWRIVTAGPFEYWLAHSSATTSLNSDHQQRLHKRIDIARRWWMAWHQGHAQPFDETVLHHALEGGGLSETTLPGVLQAAQATDFDADALLRHLKSSPIPMAKGTRKLGKRQWQQLKAYLEQLGYLDERPQLSATERRHRALEGLSPKVNTQEAGAIHAMIDRLELGGSDLKTSKPN